MKEPIYVTKTFLPDLENYIKKIERIWSNHQLTNNGPFVRELESELEKYLRIPAGHLLLVSNGTLALQLGLRALDITSGEVITTPFSYVATTSSILWEGCKPVFADIDPKSLCIDPIQVLKKITPQTRAILATHVYGRPCDNAKLEQIAKDHNLKLIYDGAHAFGVEKNGESILAWGDISTLSFHATKLFHTAEGGAVIAKDPAIIDKLKLLRAFGHRGEDHLCLGINSKMSELHAALGLCVLEHMGSIINSKQHLWTNYLELLKNKTKYLLPKWNKSIKYKFAYFPILFDDEDQLLNFLHLCNKEQVYPRRYFYPALNLLPYIHNKSKCTVAESISQRILCLPMGSDAINNQRTRTLLSNL